MAARSSRPRGTASIWPQEYARGKPTAPVKKSAARATHRHQSRASSADPQIFETIDFDFEHLAQRLRESAYLTKGVWITFVDERVDRERSFYFEGGLAVVRPAPQPEQGGAPQPARSTSSAGDGTTTVEVALQYNDTYTENVLAFANNINTVDGGTH